jgi:hypothetical protein
MPMNGPMKLFAERMKAESMQADECPPWQFCALEYRPNDWSGASTELARVILFALRDEAGNLRVLVHPDLLSVVQEKDMDDLQSLLLDFQERAQLDPDSLFEQLSALGVGLLATRIVGEDFSDYPTLQSLSSGFVQL